MTLRYHREVQKGLKIRVFPLLARAVVLFLFLVAIQAAFYIVLDWDVQWLRVLGYAGGVGFLIPAFLAWREGLAWTINELPKRCESDLSDVLAGAQRKLEVKKNHDDVA